MQNIPAALPLFAERGYYKYESPGKLKNVLFYIFRFFFTHSLNCVRYSSSQRGSWGEVITVISDLWLRDSRCVQALYCALYRCTACSTAHLAVVSPLSTWPTTVIRHNITRFLTLHQMNSEGLITGLGQTLITPQWGSAGRWCHILFPRPVSHYPGLWPGVLRAPWCFLLAPDMTYCGPVSL